MPEKIDPTKRFSSRVEYYVRARPRYPVALLEFCRKQLGLGAEDRIADIGSGTGFLSELFLGNGNSVFGVEPNDEMRHAGEKLLRHFPNFHSVNATAEATGLGDGAVGFVVAGQAFHWFDHVRCRAEFKRILKPGGWVALVWNERRSEAEGFSRRYEKLVREFETDLKDVSHRQVTATGSEAMNRFFQPAGFAVETFDNPQFLDLDGVIARALSSSYLPLPGQARSEEMLDRLREIFGEFSKEGKVVQGHEAKVYYGRLV